MLRKIYLTLLLSCLSIYGFSQSGALKGTVTDDKTRETIPFAAVVAYLNGSQAGATQTDLDGNYTLKPLTPGKYDIKVVILGYAPKEIKGVLVASDKTAYADIKLSTSAIELKEFTVEEYKVPLIQKDNTSAGNTVTREDIAAAPTREVNAVAATAAGVTQVDNGSALNIRGSRTDATAYYVDGIKVQGGATGINLANAGVEQVEVITGGTPAQYGDLTGGVINITTRGPAKTFNGGVELISSELTDAYGYNLASVNLSGPLYTRRGETQPVLGFFVAAEGQYDREPSPSANPVYKVKDAKLAELRANPLTVTPDGTILKNAEFLTMNDLEKVKVRPNMSDKSIRVNAKVDFKPTQNTNFTVGGTFYYNSSHNSNTTNELLSYNTNLLLTSIVPRAYLRFTQKFGNSTDKDKDKSASVIKNAYYTLQADYAGRIFRQEDPRFGKDIFKYGHVGTFTSRIIDTALSPISNVASKNIHTGYKFTPSENNPDIAAYDNILFKSFGNFINEENDLLALGGYSNGGSPGVTSIGGVYGLFGNTGTTQGSYGNTNENQYRFMAMGSADIKKHSLSFGIEYEQLINRRYVTAPGGFWPLMKSLVNRQFNGIDISDPNNYTVIGKNMFGQDIRNYPNLIVPGNQSEFDKNFRESQGLGAQKYIDIDSYDPSVFNINMFSADELLEKGSGRYISYYGYDYKGKVLTGKQSFDKFFSDTLNRPIGAFQPNYIAAYVQDKFEFKDLIFRIGVRFDRYDANQKVLKDKYLLYETHTAGDNETVALLNGNSRPSNIGSDYAVYVDNLAKPGQVVGYRHLDDFYDASGTKVTSTELLQSGTINPFLMRPEEYQSKKVNPSAFQDYQPQINIMPRVAFSFPISDEALFYAHYDILTQRPAQSENQIEPVNYLYMANVAGSLIFNNPDLKMQKTVDYELGFKQKITNSSAITLSAFYKELRDLAQVGWVVNAFPISYQTFLNKDFGTIKGFSASYDLRRTSNLRFLASYTLQFADGTGSTVASAQNLRRTDPEIRTPLPLNFDNRHSIALTMDYRYGIGEDYDGPLYKTFKVLEGTGINIITKALSGQPYTKRGSTYETADPTQRADIPIVGGLNGSRLPWIFRVDAKLDRNMKLKYGRKGEDKKTAYLNVYILVQNVFDSQSILNVYPFTGDPLNDGYLASAQGVQKINSFQPAQQASFVDLYNVKQSAPGNAFSAGYIQPRIIRLGVSLSF